MGSFWSQFYLFFSGKKQTDGNSEYYVVPSLVGENVNGAYKNIDMWFPDYKIISIPSLGYIDVALERKQMIIIHYNSANNLVTKVVVFT